MVHAQMVLCFCLDWLSPTPQLLPKMIKFVKHLKHMQMGDAIGSNHRRVFPVSGLI
jgi:hypothetical protein